MCGVCLVVAVLRTLSCRQYSTTEFCCLHGGAFLNHVMSGCGCCYVAMGCESVGRGFRGRKGLTMVVGMWNVGTRIGR